mmetsp:Transcript_4004/g.12702  ORF Transcript_4004/g.12702 Transcript_4004/m.12702 type:complete len:94 (-) Transcript_4004:286-567(-)
MLPAGAWFALLFQHSVTFVGTAAPAGAVGPDAQSAGNVVVWFASAGHAQLPSVSVLPLKHKPLASAWNQPPKKGEAVAPTGRGPVHATSCANV